MAGKAVVRSTVQESPMMKSFLGFHRQLEEKKGEEPDCELRERRGVREQRYDRQFASSGPWSRDFVLQPGGLKIASEEFAAGPVTCPWDLNPRNGCDVLRNEAYSKKTKETNTNLAPSKLLVNKMQRVHEMVTMEL